MHNKINSLPIVIDRKATIYNGVDNSLDDIDFNPDSKVILCSDGTNVEYWLSFIFDDRRHPYSELQIELDITVDMFLEYTNGDDTYVNLVLDSANKVGVFITTQHDVIYNEVHTIR